MKRFFLSCIALACLITTNQSEGMFGWFFDDPQKDLFEAIDKGYLEDVKNILKKNPELMEAEKPETKLTPLLEAIEKNQEPIVAFLLSQNADILARSLGKWTVLMIAVKSGNQKIFDMILEKYTYLDLQNVNGNTALILATYFVKDRFEPKQQISIIRSLLEHGANPNIQGQEGTTPLMIAASLKNNEIVTLLLNKGADANLKNKKGETALEIAKKQENNQLVIQLLEKPEENPTNSTLIDSLSGLTNHLDKLKIRLS